MVVPRLYTPSAYTTPTVWLTGVSTLPCRGAFTHQESEDDEVPLTTAVGAELRQGMERRMRKLSEGDRLSLQVRGEGPGMGVVRSRIAEQ